MAKTIFGLILCAFLLSPLIANGQDIFKSVPCSDSGEIVVQGTWDVITGAIDVAINTTDCVYNGITVEGNGSISGTAALDVKTQLMDVDTTINFVGGLSQGAVNGADVTYNKTMVGTLDQNNRFTGNITESESGGGTLHFSIKELIMMILDLLRQQQPPAGL